MDMIKFGRASEVTKATQPHDISFDGVKQTAPQPPCTAALPVYRLATNQPLVRKCFAN